MTPRTVSGNDARERAGPSSTSTQVPSRTAAEPSSISISAISEANSGFPSHRCWIQRARSSDRRFAPTRAATSSLISDATIGAKLITSTCCDSISLARCGSESCVRRVVRMSRTPGTRTITSSIRSHDEESIQCASSMVTSNRPCAANPCSSDTNNDRVVRARLSAVRREVRSVSGR